MASLATSYKPSKAPEVHVGCVVECIIRNCIVLGLVRQIVLTSSGVFYRCTRLIRPCTVPNWDRIVQNSKKSVFGREVQPVFVANEVLFTKESVTVRATRVIRTYELHDKEIHITGIDAERDSLVANKWFLGDRISWGRVKRPLRMLSPRGTTVVPVPLQVTYLHWALIY